jgi:hypothetical protein
MKAMEHKYSNTGKALGWIILEGNIYPVCRIYFRKMFEIGL